MKGVLLEVAVTLPEGNVKRHRFFNDVDGPIQIGSDTTCHLCIPVPNVHAVHAEVVTQGSSLYLEDHSGGNTSDIEGPVTKLQLPYMRPVSVLLNGTGVRLDLTAGTTHKTRMEPEEWLRRVKVPPLRQASLVDSPPLERGPGGRVDATLVTRGSREEFTFSGESAVVIGRSRACQLRVPDDIEGVSGTHARLSWSNGWLLLEDLDSTNGTWVNNQRIKQVVLRPTAQHHIELGQPGASLSVRVVLIRAKPRHLGAESHVVSSAGELGDTEARACEDPPTAPPLEVRDSAGARAESNGAADSDEAQRQEHRRLEGEAAWERQWSLLNKERESLQEERRLFEEQRRQLSFKTSEDTRPTLTAMVVDDDDLAWLSALPKPDRDIFRHLATHGLVNEEEATRILGGPRQFRQFSLRFEAHLAHCPFRVRIETAGKVKCYVRED